MVVSKIPALLQVTSEASTLWVRKGGFVDDSGRGSASSGEVVGESHLNLRDKMSRSESSLAKGMRADMQSSPD